MKTFCLLVLNFLLIETTVAQSLSRRPFLGIQMERVTEDVQRIMELSDTKGVLISRVIPNSTAEKAGFKKSDILLELNGKPVNSPAEGVSIVANGRGGESFSYVLIRNKKIVKGKSEYMPYPEEKYKDIVMEYNAVQTINGLQRLIISRPADKKGPLPVLIYVGGIGCYSLDNAMDTSRAETQFLNAVTRAGYICVRAEKPGVGDNTACKKCEELSFEEEMLGYVSAVNYMKKHSLADSNRLFVFGHSMGGVFAPMIAQKTSFAGAIAYGTIGSNFMEYLLKTRRTIGEAYNWKPEETDDFIKDYCECASMYFVNRMSTEEITKTRPDCKEMVEVFDLRSDNYNQQLYEANIPALWKDFKGKALLLWGEADYIASKEDHQIITNTINLYHPGNAEFRVVPNSSHGFAFAKSFQDAQKNEGPFNPAIIKEVISWLKSAA